jgi:uncharacterized protein YegL
MSWAAQRRAMIILSIFCLFGIFVVLPYWYLHREVPTCFDSKQNSDETGVDCGGSCMLVCRENVRDFNVLWARVFAVRPGVYDAVAYIENPNFNIAAPRVPYTAKLEDADGQVIASVSGETWSSPNERFAIFEGNMQTGDRIPETVLFEFPSNIPWYKMQKQEDDLSVSDKILVSPDKSPKLSATLKSKASETLRGIQATVVVYDRQGNPIGASATKVEKVEQGGSAKLYFTWTKPFLYDATNESCATPVDVVLVLDRSGSMSSDGKNPPEPLTAAKNAAAAFTDRMTPNDQVAFLSFATDASNPIDRTLTDQFSRVKQTIKDVFIHADGTQYTNIGDAFYRAREELAAFRHNPDAKPTVVLLTDGDPTYPKEENNPKAPEQYARKRAEELKAAGASIYTIGLGSEVKSELLVELATSPEYYYPAASGRDLGDIYQQIATSICKKGPSVIEVIPRVNTLHNVLGTN